MNTWKIVLESLSNIGKILVRWHLQSGSKPYMLVPEREHLLGDRIDVAPPILYTELLKIEISKIVKTGKLEFPNDIERCRQALIDIPGVLVDVSEEGLGITITNLPKLALVRQSH